MKPETPRRLGRGLEALISTARQQREVMPDAPQAEGAPKGSELKTVRIADVHANQFQPRRVFADGELAELEASLRMSGILQPITVRHRAAGGWELVAGERRLRAATRLGWTEIPAIVRDFDDREMLTLALVENLQRADLNALEEAEGYQRLIDEFGLTQQQVADAVGKDRTTITNLIRVLTLPGAVRKMVDERHISAGHARALLPVKNEKQMIALANDIVARQLSVRDVEARARALGKPNGDRPLTTTSAQPTANAPSVNPHVRRLEDQLARACKPTSPFEKPPITEAASRFHSTIPKISTASLISCSANAPTSIEIQVRSPRVDN